MAVEIIDASGKLLQLKVLEVWGQAEPTDPRAGGAAGAHHDAAR